MTTFTLIVSGLACGDRSSSDVAKDQGEILSGNSTNEVKSDPTSTPIPFPTFQIMDTQGNFAERFDRVIEVFKVPIYARPVITDQDLLLVSHIFAQWIDNDENGTVDNGLVHEAIINENQAPILKIITEPTECNLPMELQRKRFIS